jgi:hypothetical protein
MWNKSSSSSTESVGRCVQFATHSDNLHQLWGTGHDKCQRPLPLIFSSSISDGKAITIIRARVAAFAD